MIIDVEFQRNKGSIACRDFLFQFIGKAFLVHVDLVSRNRKARQQKVHAFGTAVLPVSCEPDPYRFVRIVQQKGRQSAGKTVLCQQNLRRQIIVVIILHANHFIFQAAPADLTAKILTGTDLGAAGNRQIEQCLLFG